MQKILQLGIKDWITGVGIGRHIEDTGIFHQMDGWNPCVNPALSSDDFGLLQTGSASTQVGSGTADETVTAFIPHNSTEMYALGTSGDIYSIALADDAVTLNSNRGVNIQNGFFSKGGGTEYFYYFQETQIGRYDLASTYTDGFWTGLTSTTIRPVHYWAQTFWFGNVSTVGKLVPASLPGTGALGAANLNVLDFDPEYTVKCLSDDDYYLVVGVSTQTASQTLGGTTKVVFWDGFSPSWNKEWFIPEPSIQAIQKTGNIFYAVCSNALYAFNFSTSPVKILDLDSSHTINVNAYNAITQIGDAVMWGAIDINAYGRLNSRIPKAYYQPMSFALRATTVNALNSNASYGKIYIAGNDSKIYQVSLLSGGNVNDLNNAITHWIDLKDVYQITGIRINFGTRLVSGNNMTITVEGYDGTSAFTQNINPTFTGLGAVSRAFFPLELRGHEVRLTFSVSGIVGNVKIKDVILYGTKTNEL